LLTRAVFVADINLARGVITDKDRDEARRGATASNEGFHIVSDLRAKCFAGRLAVQQNRRHGVSVLEDF